MKSIESLENITARLEQRYQIAWLEMIEAHANLAAQSSYPYATAEATGDARERLQKASDQMMELSHQLDALEFQIYCE